MRPGFLTLRRQSGKVKLALLLFLSAVCFAADVFCQAAGYAANAARPVEYVLSAPAAGPLLNAKMEGLRSTEDLTGISLQREYTITYREKTLTVVELSPRYLATCYGIGSKGAGSRFWLSPQAFSDFTGAQEAQVRLTYQTEDAQAEGLFIADGSLSGEGMAVAEGSSLTLDGSATVRVMFPHRDLTAVSRLESQGFTVQNRESLLAQDYETQLLLTRLRYGAIACGLALAAGWAMYQLGKREVASREEI